MKKFFVVILITAHVALWANQHHDQADQLWNRAMASKKAKDYTGAIEHLTAALVEEKKSGNVRNSEFLMKLKELGSLRIITGDYEKALRSYEMARDFAAKTGDPSGEADAWFGLGKASSLLKRDDEALERYGRSLAIEKSLGRKDKIVTVLNSMASACRKKGDYDRAGDYYSKAIDELGNSGFDENRAALTSNLGTVYFYAGKYDRALACYEKALYLDRRNPHSRNVSTDMGNIGSVYQVTGKYGDAIERYRAALDMDLKSKNINNIVLMQGRLGEMHYLQGDYVKSLELYRSALEFSGEPEFARHKAYIFIGMGKSYDARGDLDRALDCYLRALEGTMQAGGDELVNSRLSDIGMLYESRGRYNEALSFFSRSVKSSGSDSLKSHIRANNLRNVARVLLHLKRHGQALTYINQALGLDRAEDNRQGIVNDLVYLGRYHFYSGNFQGARQSFAEAVKNIIDIKLFREDLSPSERDAFMWHIDASVKCGFVEEAAGLFLKQQLFSSGTYLSDGVLADLIKGIEQGGPAVAQDTAVIRVANLTREEPLILLQDISSTRAFTLDKKNMIKHFYTHYEKEINTYCKSVDSELDSVKNSEAGPFHMDFQKIIYYYLHLLGKGDITRSEQNLIKVFGADLYSYFLRQIEPFMRGRQTLIIQSDDVLMSFPFDSLVMPDGAFVAEKFTVLHRRVSKLQDAGTAFSGRVISLWPDLHGTDVTLKNPDSEQHREYLKSQIEKKLKARQSLEQEYGDCGMGACGDIPFRELEKKALETCLPGVSHSLIEGKQCCVWPKSAAAGRARALHLGTAYQGMPSLPLLACLSMPGSKGDSRSLVDLGGIADAGIDVDFISVSSVNTGALCSGESAAHVCASLLSSGAGAASVPLWQVNDSARALFMYRLYRAIMEGERGTAEIMAGVKQSLIKGSLDDREQSLFTDTAEYEKTVKKMTNPHYWATFVLYE